MSSDKRPRESQELAGCCTIYIAFVAVGDNLINDLTLISWHSFGLTTVLQKVSGATDRLMPPSSFLAEKGTIRHR